MSEKTEWEKKQQMFCLLQFLAHDTTKRRPILTNIYHC